MAELTDCFDALQKIEGVDADVCRTLREKLAAQQFNLLVVGQFKRGKSSVINALLGAPLLPVGVVPLTSIATIITFGDSLTVTVTFESGDRKEIESDEIALFATERGNPGNEKRVSEVLISYPSSYLRNGVRLIDTPGVGSVYSHNTDVSYRYLPMADAVLFLLSADQPISQAETEFIADVREYAGKMFFLLNKADYLKEDDLAEAVDFTRTTIAKALKAEPVLFTVSAQLALEGEVQKGKGGTEKSGFPALTQALSDFLALDKHRVLVDSVARAMLRLMAQLHCTLALERSSLRTPLDELESKLTAFRQKKQEVLLSQEEFGILLDGEVKRIVNQMLEPELGEFIAKLVQTTLESLEKRSRDLPTLSTRELHDVLERHVVEEIQQACNSWRGDEDRRIGEAFTSTCTRFTSRLDDVVDGLYRFAAELFAVPYESIRIESPTKISPVFSYKFWSEPGAMYLFTSSLVLRLPRIVGRRIVLENVKKFARETINMHSGRLRHDFVSRLDKSMRLFRRELMEKLEVTLSSIERALAQGSALASSKGDTSRERERQLDQLCGALDALKVRLDSLREKHVATDAR